MWEKLEKLTGPRFIWFSVRIATKFKRIENGMYHKDPGIIGKFHDILVVRSRVRSPYLFGRSTWQARAGYRVHRVEHIYVCWYRGEVIGHAAKWICGPFTPHFELLHSRCLRANVCLACETKFVEEKSSATQHPGVDCR